MVYANSLPLQFFHPPFALADLTQRTLGNQPQLNETDIFSNWQKGHSFLEGPGPIRRPPYGSGFHLQCKSGCYPGGQ